VRDSDFIARPIVSSLPPQWASTATFKENNFRSLHFFFVSDSARASTPTPIIVARSNTRATMPCP
jgi:hypothetical protein